MAELRSIAAAATAAATTTAAVAAAATTAAAATVAAAATTAAAATVSTATATTTAATRTLFARLGFVDGQGAAIDLLAIEGGDDGLRLFIGRHLDEAEALAAAAVAIGDDFRALHGAVRAAELLEIRAGGVVRK